ncbi:MAG: hypothetical protein V7637_2012 [Mycobacteriales bacterium]
MVLVLRALGLGDFLTGVPALRGLRRRFPGHEIVLAAPGELAPLAGLTGAVDRVLPTHALRPLRWAGTGRLDVLVNLHGRGPQSHRLLAVLPARYRIGFRCPDVPGFDGPAWRPDEHEVRRWCRLLTSVGVPCDPTDLLLHLPDPLAGRPAAAGGPAVSGGSAAGVPGGVVVVHPGAAYGARRWPVERFAAVARELARSGRRVVVTGGMAELPLARRLAALAGLPPAAVAAGRTTLPGLARLVAGAGLVVCGDTGIAHLATATGTRSVLLFGPVPPAEWGPLRDLDRHAVLWAGRRGNPHGTEPDPGLLALTVADVLAAVCGLLAGTSVAAC